MDSESAGMIYDSAFVDFCQFPPKFENLLNDRANEF